MGGELFFRLEYLTVSPSRNSVADIEVREPFSLVVNIVAANECVWDLWSDTD